MASKCPCSSPDILLTQIYFTIPKNPNFVFFPWYLFLVAINRNSTILSDKKPKIHNHQTSSFLSCLTVSGNTRYRQRAATSHVLWHLLPPGGSYVTSRLDTAIVPDCLISFRLQVIFFPTRGQSMMLLVWNPQTVEMGSFTEEGDKGTSEQDSQVSWRAIVDGCAQGRARYWGFQGHISRRLTHGPQKLSSMVRNISNSCGIYNTHPRKPWIQKWPLWSGGILKSFGERSLKGPWDS